MAIPSYAEVMLPLLRHVSDGQEYTFQDVVQALEEHFKLTDDDKRERIASGRQRTFDNRVGWTRTYLKKAVLIDYAGRGRFYITDRGRQVLNEKPGKLDSRYLMQFPEFKNFVKPAADNADETPQDNEALLLGTIDPSEALDNSYKAIQKALTDQLLEKVKSVSPLFFEKLVIDMLIAMGYGGSRNEAIASMTKQSGDGGIDGIINEDRLGLEKIYIQAKRWEDTVGRPKIQEFAGSLQGFGARKGVFITTSSFSREAIEFVKNLQTRIVLINGTDLVKLMFEYNVGVSEKDHYILKEIDFDYFEA